MAAVIVEYPENLTATLNTDRGSFERDAKMAMASKLFELGRLTSGQAAMLVGVDRVDFLLECPRYGVPSVCWDAEEVSKEFKGL